MYCNRCGAHIPEDADFCPQCGCRVSGKAAQAQMQEGIPIRRAQRSNSVIIGAILLGPAAGAILGVQAEPVRAGTAANTKNSFGGQRGSKEKRTNRKDESIV